MHAKLLQDGERDAKMTKTELAANAALFGVFVLFTQGAAEKSTGYVSIFWYTIMAINFFIYLRYFLRWMVAKKN